MKIVMFTVHLSVNDQFILEQSLVDRFTKYNHQCNGILLVLRVIKSLCRYQTIATYIVNIMTSAPAAQPPGPVYYLTPGEAVTCLCLRCDHLYVGTVTGNIIIYSASSWSQTGVIPAFRSHTEQY